MQKTKCEAELEKEDSSNKLLQVKRDDKGRKRWSFYNKLIHTEIEGGKEDEKADGIMKRPIGQFKFTEAQREKHNKNIRNKKKIIYLTDIGELAFGRFIYDEPERKCWFELLKKKIAADKNNPSNDQKLMREIIDEVREIVDKEPAIRPKKKFPEYWIITPPGSFANRKGDTKTRHVHIGRLDESKKKSLVARGFDILPKDKWKFEDLKSRIPGLEKWSVSITNKIIFRNLV